ncbi:uncharacterized protein P174DRAFT_510672 [Aspergillus novofumigatus IBT 16806]|uniref:Polyketide synthase n=1 Tax=Aspergillus novofumigatus (strain IBT 16806) TaxID=1392255 RepID=A0A2I1CJE8_ASPN1|nr:uncharacterized protein P174DRAFT_510672 [Aspergillus novofumigatus IBT 16806]PKX97737.1 hypothetical protein P174DRAFT_510672 [Aspergillus novofumigatus IBT 16806]
MAAEVKAFEVQSQRTEKARRQARAPSASYLDSIRTFILNHPVLHCIPQQIDSLHQVWSLLSERNDDIAHLSKGRPYADYLIEWLRSGASEAVALTSSGIVALPRLAIIQITQYFQYLENQGLSHAEFIAQVRRRGGIQGYCGGLPAAIALASAYDEHDLVQSICTAIRLAYAIGLYAELGDDSDIPGTTTMVVRLKHEGQAEELLRGFPNVHISAITDPKSVSLVGTVDQIRALQVLATQQRLLTQNMDIRGKTHNPENAQLSEELAAICVGSCLLDLPGPDRMHAPVRTNRTGELITHGSTTEEIVKTVLASRCEWYRLLEYVAEDLKASGQDSHTVVSFGIGDCVPLMPFHRRNLQVTKITWGTTTKPDSPSSNTGMRTERSFTSESEYAYPEDAVAVIGASCRLPGADNLEQLWALLSTGQDRHEEIPKDRFDLYGGWRASQSGSFCKTRRFYGNFLGDSTIKQFDHAFFGINAREMANMDPQQRLLLELSYEAMELCGYMRSHIRDRNDPIGCFIGGSFVEYLDNTNAHPPTAYTSTGTIRAFLCGRLSYHFGWSGPAEVIDTACSSSLVAVNRAVKAVQRGECSMALAGGINLITGANNFLDLARAGFLSPTGQCKPFDKDADGYCRSEGAGLVVLKSLKQAQADGDHILAVITAAATNQGGLSCGITVPEPKAQSQLYQSALRQANILPDQITYVEAHGTGTQAGDPIEVASVRSVLGSPSRTHELHLGSIKGNIGHCETAAGIAGLLKVICMLQHNRIPPQASHRPWAAPFKAALVNSYGAAGSNAAVICCEPPRPRASLDWPITNQRHPIILSAATATSLRRYQRALVRYLTSADSPKPLLGEIAYTLSEMRQRHKHFFTFEATDNKDLLQKLGSADKDQPPIRERLSMSPILPPVVLMFGGQSRQTLGLPRQFYDRFPLFRTYLDQCNDILQELQYPPIFPAVFDTETQSDIVVLQTGFVAVQYASARTWLDAGLRVNALIGHSLGELTALAVSGVLDLRSCLRLVAARATLMRTRWGPDKGAMLAVFARRDQVEETLSDSNRARAQDTPSLEIACYNSETSHVVSGPASAIEELKARLDVKAIKWMRVDTSNGFHSPLVDPILAELEKETANLDWQSPKIPIELCREEEESSVRPFSPSDHARKAVFFMSAVRRTERRLGGCIWLEAGMDTPVIAMTKRAVASKTAASQSHVFVATTTKDEALASNAISTAVTELWACGVDVTPWLFLDRRSPAWLPPYQFDETIGWLPNIDRAAELQKQIESRPHITVKDNPRQKDEETLVSMIPSTDDKQKKFSISVHSERFRRIVCGHVVCQRALCPASVYLECVTMALDLLFAGDQAREKNQARLEFEALDIQSPLGLAGHHTEIILEELAPNQHWQFTVCSQEPTKKTATSHAKGRVMRLKEATSSTKLETMARLLGPRVQEMATDEESERMLSKRVYGMFSRVVDYAPFLKGISRILIRGHEAVARVTIPGDGQPARNQSTAVATCDAVTLDNFIQVIGLLMNTDDMVGETEVMVCTGIDSTMLAPTCNLLQCSSWKVYASYVPTGPSQALGDAFVFAPDDTVMAAFVGCRFAKLDMSRLARLLDTANKTPKARTASTQSAPPSPGLVDRETPPDLVSDRSSDDESPDTPGSDASFRIAGLREMFETYTGVSKSQVLDGAMLMSELGLDSLAATEMAEELQSSYGVIINSQDLVSTSIQELEGRVSGPPSHKSTKKESRAVQSSSEKQTKSVAEAADPSHLAQMLADLLIETTGCSPSSIKPSVTLEELGVDSLALTEVLASLTDEAGDHPGLSFDGISLQSKIENVHLAISVTRSQASAKAEETTPDVQQKPIYSAANSTTGYNFNRLQLDPIAGLNSANLGFQGAAEARRFLNYWNDVALHQGRLTLAYIVEAWRSLGVDLATLAPGNPVAPVQYQPKYTQLMKRLEAILVKHGVLVKDSSTLAFVRGPNPVPSASSSQLHQEFVFQYPAYAGEAHLMALTGPSLAPVLRGTADPIKLLFGTAKAGQILEEYYHHSPMLSTLTDQLVTFIMGSISSTPAQDGSHGKLRILEAGAGTGGTTVRLVERLAQSGVPVEYVFTDISPSMVSKAKQKFAATCPWMRFEKVDLEQPVPEHLKERFDIVIGTNCVHATSDRVRTTRHIREMLHDRGFLVLSEVTRIIDWYDLVFGLLDGWWLADGGTSYPLQPADSWMTAFRQAGFRSTFFTESESEDSNTQQLLVAIKSSSNPNQPDRLPVIYKKVDGISIGADVFLPPTSAARSMGVAIMIHGGGHMTLSRKAIRPGQIAHLLAQNMLPVSIDYRLCPETNVIDGAMADTRDAVVWARRFLPGFLKDHGIQLDPQRLVVVGWSTGGHLAMSTAWTLRGYDAPPAAILAFYAPTDFNSPDAFDYRGKPRPSMTGGMTREEIRALPLASTPTSSHHVTGPIDQPEVSWLQAGDTRSELLLSLLRETRDYGLSLILNGPSSSLPPLKRTIGSLLDQAASPERTAYICPTSQLRAGEYHVPTFLIHGERDELASFSAAERFHSLLQKIGVQTGFLAVPDGSHIHDVGLRPGMPKWEQYVAPGYAFLQRILDCA